MIGRGADMINRKPTLMIARGADLIGQATIMIGRIAVKQLL